MEVTGFRRTCQPTDPAENLGYCASTAICQPEIASRPANSQPPTANRQPQYPRIVLGQSSHEARNLNGVSKRFRVRFFLAVALGLSMAMSLGLLAARFAATGEFGYRFLVWNLFLAAIPFPLAVMAEQFVHTRHSLIAVPILIAWLLFLPNAPYLVTDILHLRETNVPLWYDTLLYGSFAVTGMLLCIGSLSLVHLAVQRRLGVTAGWVVAMSSLMLSGFGVRGLSRTRRTMELLELLADAPGAGP